MQTEGEGERSWFRQLALQQMRAAREFVTKIRKIGK